MELTCEATCSNLAWFAKLMATSSPPDENQQLVKKDRIIANLKEDIRRLSAELKSQSELLTNTLDVAHEQSLQIASLKAALQDTVAWDPTSSPPQPSSSTPRRKLQWSEVMLRRKKRTSLGVGLSSHLSLSNSFEPLSSRVEAPDSDELKDDAARPTSPQSGSHPLPAAPISAAPLPANSWQPPRADSSLSPLAHTTETERQQKKQSRLTHKGETMKLSNNKVNGSQANARPRAREHSAKNKAKRIDTILIGDFIMRQVEMARTENLTVNNTSVREVAAVLPDIMTTQPHIKKIVIHAGSFDILTNKSGSETLKKDFLFLLETLKKLHSGVSFISGPIPTLGRGYESFSRLLGLSTWLSSACLEQQVGFIDNFNIFWNIKSRFMSDGIHPNNLGSRYLGCNIRHTIESSYQNICALISRKVSTQGADRQTVTAPKTTTASHDDDVTVCDSVLHITRNLQRLSLSQKEC